MPYLFNGKELDEETGFYYYGARYYDSRNSLWLSVDPLAEKYPGISPYCYTMNNPVKFIDPDGREIVDANGNEVNLSKDTNGKFMGDFIFKKGTSQAVIDDFMNNGGILLKEMISIEIGQKYVNDAIKSKEKISYRISDFSPKSSNNKNNFKLAGTRDIKDKNGNIIKTQITIYKGSIQESIKNGKIDGRLSIEQNMAARAVHETHHATNKNDIDVRRNKGVNKLSKEQHQNAYDAGNNATFQFQIKEGLIE